MKFSFRAGPSVFAFSLIEPSPLAEEVRVEGDWVVAYYVMPGVRKSEIEVYVDERLFVVRAPVSAKFPSWLPEEYRFETKLPRPVDPDTATAKYRSGILEVRAKAKLGSRISVG